MKAVKPFKFLEQWEKVVELSLFPEQIFKQSRPDQVLEQWGEDLHRHRSRLRIQTDLLIQEILSLHTDEDVVPILLKTDRELVAAYYDRLKSVGRRLRAQVHLNDAYENPGGMTWRDLAMMLLLRETFH